MLQFPGESGNTPFIPLHNPRGDAVALIDTDADSTVVERYRYTDYGQPLIEPVEASGNWPDDVTRTYSFGNTKFLSEGSFFPAGTDWEGKSIRLNINGQMVEAYIADAGTQVVGPQLGALNQAQIVDNDKSSATVTLRGDWPNLITTSDYVKDAWMGTAVNWSANK